MKHVKSCLIFIASIACNQIYASQENISSQVRRAWLENQYEMPVSFKEIPMKINSLEEEAREIGISERKLNRIRSFVNNTTLSKKDLYYPNGIWRHNQPTHQELLEQTIEKSKKWNQAYKKAE